MRRSSQSFEFLADTFHRFPASAQLYEHISSYIVALVGSILQCVYIVGGHSYLFLQLVVLAGQLLDALLPTVAARGTRPEVPSAGRPIAGGLVTGRFITGRYISGGSGTRSITGCAAIDILFTGEPFIGGFTTEVSSAKAAVTHRPAYAAKAMWRNAPGTKHAWRTAHGAKKACRRTHIVVR